MPSYFLKSTKEKVRTSYDDEHLKELVNTVMIRNRRADTRIEWTKRQVETIIIDFSKTEQALYDAVSQFKAQSSAIQ